MTGTPEINMAKKMEKREGWHEPVEHHHAWVAIVGVIIIAAVVLYAGFSRAAGDRYKFVARGVITFINDDNSLDVSVTHVTGKGEDDLKGAKRTFKTVSTTKYYKVASGKDKRITRRNLAVGQEIGFKGVAKDDGSYVITWLRVHDRSFTVIGKLKDVDRGLKEYKVAVTTSTYRPGTYNGKDVIMNYGGNTKFTSGGVERNADEVKVGDQKVRITGTVTDHGKWEISTLQDNYTGK